MKQKNKVILFTYVIAAFVVLGTITGISMKREADLRRYVENGWKRSFSVFASDLSQINTALQKCLYSGSPALMGSSFGEIYARTQEAQQNLSELPLSAYLLEKTTGFLGTLGDYARTLSRNVYAETPDRKQMEILNDLYETTEQLSNHVTALQNEIEQGILTIDEQLNDSSIGAEGLGSRLSAVEDEFPELPTLIYDGPYSNSVAQEEAMFLIGKRIYSEAEALKTAESFLDMGGLRVVGRQEGNLPCFLIEGSDCWLRISIQGGRLVDFYCYENVNSDTVSIEDALIMAKEYLSQKGYFDLSETYWRKENDTLLVNYAASEEGIILYPDLVKLRISLSTGKVIGLDFTGYLLNHHSRSYDVRIQKEEAKEGLSAALTPLNSRLTLIPTEGKQEKLCWEFYCRTAQETACLVYIDSVSGEESKLLLLLEDENGTLTM